MMRASGGESKPMRVGSGNRPAFDSLLLLLSLLIFATGCDRLDMYDQPRYEPLEASKFFRDGLSSRPLVEGTIARGPLHADAAYATGRTAVRFVSQIPDAAYQAIYDRQPGRFQRPYAEVDKTELRLALLQRGQQRFEIYCSTCHGATGAGDGMIVRRGFRQPPSYHSERLRQAAAGHFFEVMTSGFGAMASYASRVDIADRWAIVAYIRALQLSQNAALADVPAEKREALMSDDPQAVEDAQ